MGVDHLSTVFLGADAILPMVLISEAAAWPTEVRNLNMLECVNHILADTIDIGNLRILANPETAIDAVSEVLGEVAIDVTIDDDRVWCCGIDGDHSAFRLGCVLDRGSRAGRGERGHRGEAEELAEMCHVYGCIKQ